MLTEEDVPAPKLVWVGRRVRNYVFLYLCLILYIIWADAISHVILTAGFRDWDELEITQKIGASIISLLSALSMVVTNLFRDTMMHIVLDDVFFKVVPKTNIIMRDSLRKKALLSGVEPAHVELVTDEMQDSINLFWHFAGRDTENFKSLRFRNNLLLEQYYVNLYGIALGIAGMLIALALVLNRGKTDIVAVVPVFFVVIAGGLYFSTKHLLVKKIYAAPVQQIADIRSEELREEVERRFKQMEHPGERQSNFVSLPDGLREAVDVTHLRKVSLHAGF
jgi:hypothetical protein